MLKFEKLANSLGVTPQNLHVLLFMLAYYPPPHLERG
jgi:hypothetical protein